MKSIAPEEYYHLCNRGVRKHNIFHDRSDWVRFLFLILYFQSPVIFEQIGRITKKFVRHSMFDIEPKVENKVISSRFVELTSFCLIPNHFHLLVKEVEEGGISKYMQRVLNSYTKYYNAKYEKNGHLFQGSYRSIHVDDNEQLLHLSAYIHRNPRELDGWKGRENEYNWSSYYDFVAKNRWGKLLVTEIISEQFKNQSGYRQFVESSTTKLSEGERALFEI